MFLLSRKVIFVGDRKSPFFTSRHSLIEIVTLFFTPFPSFPHSATAHVRSRATYFYQPFLRTSESLDRQPFSWLYTPSRTFAASSRIFAYISHFLKMSASPIDQVLAAIQRPTIDRPFGVHLWPIFDKAFTAIKGYHPQDFDFQPHVTPCRP